MVNFFFPPQLAVNIKYNVVVVVILNILVQFLRQHLCLK